ncbi:MAG: SUMF1/EgtB/PvdO family nonheme iron enzyme [Pseudomonadota bacterium]
MRYIDFSDTTSMAEWANSRTRRRAGLPQDEALRLYQFANLASVADFINRAGHSMVDLKPVNVRAFRNGSHIAVIDCDGFGIKGKGRSITYAASAVTPKYLAPEFQGLTDFTQIDETQDRFAFAVMLFEALNLGAHPANGSGPNVPNMVEERIRKRKFYIDPSSGMTPPFHDCIPYLPDQTVALFKRAFVGKASDRPAPREWRDHLRDIIQSRNGLSFSRCATDPNHIDFGKGCATCAKSRGKKRTPNLQVSPAVAKKPTATSPANPTRQQTRPITAAQRPAPPITKARSPLAAMLNLFGNSRPFWGRMLSNIPRLISRNWRKSLIASVALIVVMRVGFSGDSDAPIRPTPIPSPERVRPPVSTTPSPALPADSPAPRRNTNPSPQIESTQPPSNSRSAIRPPIASNDLAESTTPETGSSSSDEVDLQLEFASIRAGTMTLGSSVREIGRSSDETLRSFTLPRPLRFGTKEVTFRQWDACVEGGGCRGYSPEDNGWGRGDQPVINVSWIDAKAFAKWASAEESKCLRLPTDDEWEYAARYGQSTQSTYVTGSSISMTQANFDGVMEARASERGAYQGRPIRVGRYSPSASGLYDLVGNVSEWVETCETGGDCTRRGRRGGSWASPSILTRTANRDFKSLNTRDTLTGFRLVWDEEITSLSACPN